MHALVLRSPHAHAKFTINASRARGLPGVGAILTAEDVKDLGDLPCLFNLEVDPFTGPPYPILANGEVRHVGDAVAFVVAETSIRPAMRSRRSRSTGRRCRPWSASPTR
jgi:carbon-monoxide dehydrogenase large subunit